jgi:hypothetical protein
MSTHTMRVAKASDKDIEVTRDFLQACESLWDSRNQYCLRPSEKEWLSWDEDEPDYKECVRIRKEVAMEEGLAEREVDNRLVMYEFLMKKYKRADCHWGRVIMAADVLIDNVCDPTERTLEFYPGFECFHVAPEQ